MTPTSPSPVRRAAAAVAATVLATLAVGGLTAPAHAADAPQDPGSVGVRLLEAPALLADDPRAHTYIIDHLEPGDTITRAIEVVNTTDAAQQVEVYAGPADIVKGSWTVGDPGAANELTSWVSTSRSTLQVPSQGSRRFRARIEVPDDASGGERYGVVWASIASSGEGAMQMVNRVGIRMYLDVGGPEAPPSDFAITSLQPRRSADGTPSVVATIANRGERALDLSGRLRLTGGPGGAKAGPFALPGGITLGIGQQVSAPIELDKALPDGPWDARLVARSGTLKRTAEARLTFPEPAQAGPPVTPRTTGALPDTGSGPGLPLLIALGIAVLGIPLFVLWRRRREEEELAVAPTATVTDDQWLASLDRWAGPPPGSTA